MQEKIKGIVLNVRKYNDSNDIVTLFTPRYGRLSFISPIGKGKASNARRARLQPLAVISTEINLKSSVELQRLGSISLEKVWTDIYSHPVKCVEAIFISEFLYRILNATMPDENLWNFIYESLILLDNMKTGVSDFHLSFLISLLPYMGIQPDVSGYSPEKVFDFEAGCFVSIREAKGHYLKDEEAKAVILITRLNFINIRKLRLTTVKRRLLLQHILLYYSVHYPGISTMKSVNVLQDFCS